MFPMTPGPSFWTFQGKTYLTYTITVSTRCLVNWSSYSTFLLTSLY